MSDKFFRPFTRDLSRHADSSRAARDYPVKVLHRPEPIGGHDLAKGYLAHFQASIKTGTLAPAKPCPRIGHSLPMTATARLLIPLRASLLALLVSLVFAGCTLLAPYDAVADRQMMELITLTEGFLARYLTETDASGRAIRPGRSYDSGAATFYQDARGNAAALLLRAEQKAANQDEIDVLRRLGGRYRRLEDSHRLGAITFTSAAPLRRSLRSLTQIQLHKKHLSTTPSDGDSDPSPAR